jgi:uncharacterized protein YegP (UPF0339 family)
MDRSRIHVEVYRGASEGDAEQGQPWRFRVLSGNGEILAQGEGYEHQDAAVETAELVVGPGVSIVEVTAPEHA